MKLVDIVFLEVEDVELAHARALAEHGGADGLRDRDRLAAAVMTPRATWDRQPLYPTLADVAAAYAVGLTLNHAFVDGNKRTAFICMLAFLDANGIVLTLGDAWIPIFETLAEGKLAREELVARLTAEMPNADPVKIEP